MQDGCLGSCIPLSRGKHGAVWVLKKQKCGKHALPQAFHDLLRCGLCLIKYSWEGTSKTANSHPYFKNYDTETLALLFSVPSLRASGHQRKRDFPALAEMEDSAVSRNFQSQFC